MFGSSGSPPFDFSVAEPCKLTWAAANILSSVFEGPLRMARQHGLGVWGEAWLALDGPKVRSGFQPTQLTAVAWR